MKKQKPEYSEQEQKNRKHYKIELLACLISAILIEIYFIGLNIINKSMPLENFNICIKILYILFALIAVAMLELAYKKEKKNFVITGIEFILLATHTLLISRTILTASNTDILSTSYIWLIYHLLKAVIIYTNENRRRLKQISDISEIVKEEKPIKKVAKKRKK